MKKLTILIIACFLIINYCFSQTGINWSEYPKGTKEKEALYKDAMASDNYIEALPHLEWLLQNAPSLHLSIYINADKLYKRLVTDEMDIAKKQELQDRHIAMYDQRIKYFGDKEKVTGRKAYAAYRYYRKEPGKSSDLYQLFEEVMAFKEKDIMSASLGVYMDVVRLYQVSGQSLSDEEILGKYIRTIALMQRKDLSEKYLKVTDKIMLSMLGMNCESIQGKLLPACCGDTLSVPWAERLGYLAELAHCEDGNWLLDVQISLFKKEPNAKDALRIAKGLEKIGREKEASYYYQKAIELAVDDKMKAKAHYAQALYYQRQGAKVRGREAALQALGHDPALTKAYKVIGDLYLDGAKDCMQRKSRVHDRLLYIAAFDMYEKAGDVHMMQEMKKQFPSGEEIHGENMAVGDKINTGCWANTMVMLRKR